MKTWVRLFKDGDSMGIETNCEDVDDFFEKLSLALEILIENGNFSGDWHFQLTYWLPRAFEIAQSLNNGFPWGIKKECGVTRCGNTTESDLTVDSSIPN